MSITALTRHEYFPNRRARVRVFRQQRQIPMKQHRHEFCEIAVVLSGVGVHVTGRFRHELKPGSVLVINRHRAHGYEKTQGLNLVNLLVREDVLPRIGRELRSLPGYHALFGERRVSPFISHLQLSAAELTQLEDWIDRLEAETEQPVQGGYLLAEAYLTLIVGVLCRRYGKAGDLAARSASSSFQRLLGQIEKDLARPWRVADLARLAGMSERNFHRQFRAVVGMTPVDYLLKARIHHAAERLRFGEPIRIKELAAACGFDDSNYFSRAFRRLMGKSPRDYRASLA